jgi:hypothetical protein
MFEFIKRLPAMYLPALKITAPVTVAYNAVQVQNAYNQSGLGSAAKTGAIGLLDVATLGSVTIISAISTVIKSRKKVAAPVATPVPDNDLQLRTFISQRMSEKPDHLSAEAWTDMCKDEFNNTHK